MLIGVPTEIKAQENRVALLPAGALQLTRKGHRVLVQSGAGDGVGFTDEDYRAAGAEVVEKAAEIFKRAELIVKVKEPLASEYPLLRRGQILFTYLHLAASRELTDALLASGVDAIAYESVVLNRRLPLLEPMSEIAGRMSTIMGASSLARTVGGEGVLLGGVPGVLPGKVVVIGGGTAGVNAARMAQGLGADVTILDIDLDRLRQLDATFGLKTLHSSEANLRRLLPEADLVIGAVLVPGAKAPKLVSRELLKLMKKGSVIVDIAIDQGGCIETSRPTTHAEPTFVEEGVVHYCVANMPGAYPRTATEALTNATYPYIEALATFGFGKAMERKPELATGINTYQGRLVNQPVAQAHDLAWVSWEALKAASA